MKTLYLDCSMGAAGDMLTAALLELMPQALPRLQEMGLPGVELTAQPSVKCGIAGTHMSVRVHGQEEAEHGHHHAHATPASVAALVSALRVPEAVKQEVLQIYDRTAQVESAVHGVPVTQIHFHEVGALDALADITAVCLLMHLLAPDRVVVSPVHVGSGQVRCAHGLLPVPAPATAQLLRGVPTYGGTIDGELCTPTGAALLTHFATSFGPQPEMCVTAIGYGMGKKDFPAANCVRALLGETAQEDGVLELACNLDDMPAEDIAFAMERLFDAGALEVYTQPIGMKKSRPGTALCVLCREEQRETILRLLFRHTTTLGVREARLRRHLLARSVQTVDTPLGPVRVKTAQGWGVVRKKAEYDDLATLARAGDRTLEAVRRAVQTGEEA